MNADDKVESWWVDVEIAFFGYDADQQMVDRADPTSARLECLCTSTWMLLIGLLQRCSQEAAMHLLQFRSEAAERRGRKDCRGILPQGVRKAVGLKRRSA